MSLVCRVDLMNQIPHKDSLRAELMQVAKIQRACLLLGHSLVWNRRLIFFIPFHLKIELNVGRSWSLLARIAVLLWRLLFLSTDRCFARFLWWGLNFRICAPYCLLRLQKAHRGGLTWRLVLCWCLHHDGASVSIVQISSAFLHGLYRRWWASFLGLGEAQVDIHLTVLLILRFLAQLGSIEVLLLLPRLDLGHLRSRSLHFLMLQSVSCHRGWLLIVKLITVKSPGAQWEVHLLFGHCLVWFLCIELTWSGLLVISQLTVMDELSWHWDTSWWIVSWLVVVLNLTR